MPECSIDPSSPLHDIPLISPPTPSHNLDTTPWPSESHHTRITSNGQPSVTPLKSCPPLTDKIHLNEVFVPPDHSIATQRLHGLTLVHTSKARELRDLKSNAKAFGIDEQAAREIEAAVEGAGATEVSCSCSYPVQLTSLQIEATSGFIMKPAETSSPSTASWSISRAPDISNPTDILHQGSTTLFPHSLANVIPQSSTCFFSKKQYVHHSLSSIPLHFHLATQKQQPKTQSRPFVPLHVTIHPVQQQSVNINLAYPPLDNFQPCQDE